MSRFLEIFGAGIVVIVLVVAYRYWWSPPRVDDIPIDTTTSSTPEVMMPTIDGTQLPAFVSSPFVFEGRAAGWYFEGTFPVQIQDMSGAIIAEGFAQAQGDWMTTEYVPFRATVTFDVSATTSAELVLKKDNPSGIPAYDQERRIPITVIPSDKDTMSLFVYFMDSDRDVYQQDCTYVYPLVRRVAPTEAVARAALEQLLAGPTPEEQQQGYVTTIPAGGVIQSLRIEDGVAYVDFNEQVEPAGGSCAVTAALQQIRQTLVQFSTIQDVVISIDGRRDDIFQP